MFEAWPFFYPFLFVVSVVAVLISWIFVQLTNHKQELRKLAFRLNQQVEYINQLQKRHATLRNTVEHYSSATDLVLQNKGIKEALERDILLHQLLQERYPSHGE
jgi:uncharacterized protein YlxW (UPF0749 family)